VAAETVLAAAVGVAAAADSSVVPAAVRTVAESSFR
jgi:hypothetical protein